MTIPKLWNRSVITKSTQWSHPKMWIWIPTPNFDLKNRPNTWTQTKIYPQVSRSPNVVQETTFFGPHFPKFYNDSTSLIETPLNTFFHSCFFGLKLFLSDVFTYHDPMQWNKFIRENNWWFFFTVLEKVISLFLKNIQNVTMDPFFFLTGVFALYSRSPNERLEVLTG